MALIVKVFVNNHEIIGTHAVRIKGREHGLCTYRTDDGTVLTHHYDDGANSLAVRLLDLHKKRTHNILHRRAIAY